MWLFVALKDMERMVTFEVTDYVVYLATNTSNGFGSSQYVGTAPAYVPDSLESSFAEQTTPSSLEFYDASVAFTDLDLDAGELGGNITWQEQDADASVSAVNFIDQVYTRSILAEQSTPVTTALSDLAVLVSNIEMLDDDLDEFELGGSITWSSLFQAPVIRFQVFLGPPEKGHFVAEVLAHNGQNYEAVLPLNTELSNFSFVSVFASSALAQATLGAFAYLKDVVAQVVSLSFIDEDLDAFQLGGIVRWEEPMDSSRVVSYSVVLADPSGAQQVLASTNETQVTLESLLAASPGFATRVTVALCLSNASDAVETLSLGFALPLLNFGDLRWPAAAVFFGMLTGGCAAGTLAERFGHKRLLVMMLYLEALAAVATTAATFERSSLGVVSMNGVASRRGSWHLTLCRYISGVAIGAAVPPHFCVGRGVDPSTKEAAPKPPGGIVPKPHRRNVRCLT
ncbi:unnamed protein product [Durusdinium trenchii]|uniref:Transmembrane protein n=1 Tax=Durusdinium trenchii TaxID=1381693 RepID=A0ABP0IVD7_9DINO